MKAGQVAFGRTKKGSGKPGEQAVFGKNVGGGNQRGRKSAGQTARPGGEGSSAYGRAHKSTTSYDDGYASKLGGK